MTDQEEMIHLIREKYHLDTPEVFRAMISIPRSEFLPAEYQKQAYQDNPVPIGFGQTLSQPYTVAFMTDLLNLNKWDNVLEIGTGSGYQAAVLSKLCNQIYTIEIIPQLAKKARKTFKKLNLENIKIRVGNGRKGWVEHSPYNKILITAATNKVPDFLFDQLELDGLLVAPIEENGRQIMTRYRKRIDGKLEKTKHGLFIFVPLVE